MKNFSVLSIVLSVMSTYAITANVAKVESPEVLNRRQNVAKLITDRACPGCDLIGMDLSGLDLNHVNLSGANMSGVNVSGSNLSHANLEGANLFYANLNEVNLDHTDLSYANISRIQMKDVKNIHSIKGIFKRMRMVSRDAYQRYLAGN